MSKKAHSNGHDDHLDASKAHARAAAEELRGAAEDVVHDFQERASSMAGEWKEKAKHLHSEIENYVRENPTKSVLTAVGVGFVLGLVFRR